jgi:hypothetical protein
MVSEAMQLIQNHKKMAKEALDAVQAQIYTLENR